MSTIPSNLKFSKEHEWVEVLDPNTVRVGITDYAQDSLGDIVYIELPDENSEVSKDDSFGSIESVKAVSDIFAPVTGVVKKTNESLADSPADVNSSPYEDGWIIEITMQDASELDELMNSTEYEDYLSTL